MQRLGSRSKILDHDFDKCHYDKTHVQWYRLYSLYTFHNDGPEAAARKRLVRENSRFTLVLVLHAQIMEAGQGCLLPCLSFHTRPLLTYYSEFLLLASLFGMKSEFNQSINQ